PHLLAFHRSPCQLYSDMVLSTVICTELEEDPSKQQHDSLRTLPIDPVKLPIIGTTRLVRLIAHTGALIRIGGRRSGQFVLGVRAQAQQLSAEGIPPARRA